MTTRYTRTRPRRRQSAGGLRVDLNTLVTHRRKPRWTRGLPGADRLRADEDPGVGIEQDLERETTS